jgi:hypothetical protein
MANSSSKPGFFCVTSSLFIIVDGAVETLAGVYAISFLVRASQCHEHGFRLVDLPLFVDLPHVRRA